MRALSCSKKAFLMVSMMTGALSIFGVATATAASEAVKPLRVEFHNAKGEAAGFALLSAGSEGVKIHLDVKQLTPGKHGIHFHEKALCEGPDFKSAGGHFNPGKKEHGLDNPKGAHAGDMPNIDVSRSGTARTDVVAKGATLGSGPNSISRPEGIALVIHAKADDEHSNPAGESGDRVLCAVIPPVTAAADVASRDHQ